MSVLLGNPNNFNRIASKLSQGWVGVLSQKLRRAPSKLINGLWAIPAVIIMRVLRPFVLVRVGSLNSARIGHFVADGAEHLARIQQQPTNTVDWFWLGKTSNSQWERMIRRTLPVHSWAWYLYWWNMVIPGGSAHTRPNSYTLSRDVEGLYARYDVQIPFLPSESEEALTWLRNKGWSDGEPFVCLLVRDAEFLANDPMYGTVRQRANLDWSYHNYRDSDIETYLPAVKWLAEQGVWVIRMGKLMAKRIPDGMDHVIDYAFDAGKSDLLDIWLFANCDGCISTATGPDAISAAYGKPLLFVNALPLGISTSWSRSIWVPKTLRWAETGQILSVREHLLNSWLTTNEYDRAGIVIENLSSDEIRSAVQEFWRRYSGSWDEAREDQQKQDDYRNMFLDWPEFSRFNGWLHPEARVGTAWLRSTPLS